MDWTIRLISEIRAVRSEMNVPAAAKIPMVLRGPNAESQRRLKANHDEIVRLARLDTIAVEPASAHVPKGAAQIVHGEAIAVLPLAGIIDLDAERARLTKDLDKVDKDINGIDRKLGNAEFVAKAPEDVVIEQRERRDALVETKQRLNEALKRVG